MNYQLSIKYQFNDIPVPSQGDAVILLENNDTYVEVDDFQSYISNQGLNAPTYDELLMLASGYARSVNSNFNMLGLLYHPYYADYWNATALFTQSKVDFVTIHHDSGGFDITNSDMRDAFSPAFIVRDDLKDIYPQYNYNASYSGYSYTEYDVYLGSGDFRTFDYSALLNNRYNGNGFNEIRNRDNQIDYNYTYLSFGNYTSSDGLYLSFGTPLNDLVGNEYNRGYGAGYASGRVAGFDDGYNNGVVAGGASTQSANAFSYIAQAFTSVGSILQLEVMPNVTLGLVWSIPLVFVLIMTIFKLVRK